MTAEKYRHLADFNKFINIEGVAERRRECEISVERKSGEIAGDISLRNAC